MVIKVDESSNGDTDDKYYKFINCDKDAEIDYKSDKSEQSDAVMKVVRFITVDTCDKSG